MATQLLARAREDGPVVGHGVVGARDAGVGGLRHHLGDVRAPGGRRLLREELRALHLVEAEDDLLDGEVVADAAAVARLGRGHLPAAFVHHGLEERLVVRGGASARRKEHAEVGGEAREAVLADAFRLNVLQVALHVRGRVGVHGHFHQVEVAGLRDGEGRDRGREGERENQFVRSCVHVVRSFVNLVGFREVLKLADLAEERGLKPRLQALFKAVVGMVSILPSLAARSIPNSRACRRTLYIKIISSTNIST